MLQTNQKVILTVHKQDMHSPCTFPVYQHWMENIQSIRTDFAQCVWRYSLPNIFTHILFVWFLCSILLRVNICTAERWVHTMPHGRMQHNMALLRGKSRSPYASELITSILKNNFLPTIFQFTKSVKWETCTHHVLCQKLCLATFDVKYSRGKPLMIPAIVP